jgi:hypothetical protein
MRQTTAACNETDTAYSTRFISAQAALLQAKVILVNLELGKQLIVALAVQRCKQVLVRCESIHTRQAGRAEDCSLLLTDKRR